MDERALAQEEILGVSVDVHPLEMVADQIAAAGAISSVEAALRMGELVVVAGSRLTSRRVRTSKGDLMYFLSIEDLEGLLDVVFFPVCLSSISTGIKRFRTFFDSRKSGNGFRNRGNVDSR